MLNFAFRLVARRDIAEDIVQDTFVAALESIDSYKGDASLSTWLFGIATNKARDYLKSKNRWSSDILEKNKEKAMQNPAFLKKMVDISQTASGTFSIRENIDFCFTCIGKTLPIEQQICILLKDIYDYKVREIEQITELSNSQVKHALENGRKRMSRLFFDKCSLINQHGNCQQCTEMNGFYNPKAETRRELMALRMVRERESSTKEALYELRTLLVKAIQPLESKGVEFHLCHLEHAASVAE